MTGAAWRAWGTFPLLYLSAFLCGIWPGQWFGTRLLPMAGGLMLVSIIRSFMDFPWGWPYAVVVLLLGYSIQVCAIRYIVANRDF